MRGIIALPVSAKVKFLLSLAATILGAVILAAGDGHLSVEEIATIAVGLIGTGGVFVAKNEPPAPGSGYKV